MKKIGIVGAGNMGGGIAQKTAQEGLSVVLVDIKPEFVERGLNIIKSTLQEAVERNIMKPEHVNEVLGRIKGTTELSDVKNCDLIIEAVFEDMDVKKDLFKRLDSICEPKTILATNTSSLSVDELASATNRPDRFVGLHFFYHPAKNRLLEIIPSAKTSEEVVLECKKYSTLTGKTDILVHDAPGFAVNRFFIPWYVEAIRLYEEGIANIPTIDKASMDTFGIGMGVFKLINVTGVPIALHSSESLGSSLGPIYAPPAKLREQGKSGELWPLEGEIQEDKLQVVAHRLLAVVFYVASSMLEEGIADVADTDLGAKVGLRWKRGPFELMNRIGIDKAYAMVEKLLKAYPSVKMPTTLVKQKEKGEPWDMRFVQYKRDGKVGRVIISRPDALNALNSVVIKQLDEAFAQAEADPDTKAIILESAGKAFVAGADIKFFVDCIKSNRLDDNYEFTAYGQEVFNRIDDSKKPVIAKMDGLALGGGFELALATDIIAATPKALMAFPETGIGIYPGLGGTQRMSRLIGKELAKYLIFTGRQISAQEALKIGLVDYVFSLDEIDDKILSLVNEGKLTTQKAEGVKALPADWQKIKDLFADNNIETWLRSKYINDADPFISKTAETIASKAPIALKLTNEIIDDGYKKPLKDGIKEELRHNKEIFSTKDALTGLTNVGGKPKFEGK